MAEVTQEVTQLRARVAAINLELEQLQAEKDLNLNRNQEIDAGRLKLRVEREGLSKLLDSLGVQQQVASHVQAAVDARAEAEKQLAEISEKNKQATEMLAAIEARSSATVPAPESPVV